MSSSFVPKITSSTTPTAAATSEASSAQPKLSTLIASGLISDASSSISASSTRTSHETQQRHERQPKRGDDRRQDRVETAISSAATTAPQKPSTETPGTMLAAIKQCRCAEQPRQQKPQRAVLRPLGVPGDGFAVRACRTWGATLPAASRRLRACRTSSRTSATRRVLVDLDGVRLITDPCSARASSTSGAWPGAGVRAARARRGAALARPLGPPRPALARAARQGAADRVPAGRHGLLRRKRFAHVTALAEGEDVHIGSLTVTGVHAEHEGARGPLGASGRARLQGLRVAIRLLRRRHGPLRRPGRVRAGRRRAGASRRVGRQGRPGTSRPHARSRGRSALEAEDRHPHSLGHVRADAPRAGRGVASRVRAPRDGRRRADPPARRVPRARAGVRSRRMPPPCRARGSRSGRGPASTPPRRGPRTAPRTAPRAPASGRADRSRRSA